MRLKVGYPKPRVHPPDWDGCWRVYTVCETSDPASCTTRRDISALGSELDESNARKSCVSLINKAHTGRPFSDLYDKTQCHPIHEYAHTTSTGQTELHKIWRIWGTGKTRLCFLYVPGRRIVLLSILAKRKNKLDDGEVSELESSAKAVLQCLERSNFEDKVI